MIMLAAHGFTVNRQQARGVRLRIIGGRKIDNAARYVSAALATRDGARKWAPSAPSMPPRGLDPVTAIRSAGLRGSGGYESVGDAPMPPWDQPRPVQDTLDDDVAADVAHRGAAEARKRLAERPRAEAVPVAPPSRQLHGEALAAAQLAEAREALAAAGVAEAPDDGEEDPRDITDVDLPEDGDDPPF
ncbi:MAG TPA: hypothetical protein VH136_18600 [Trebonia sp.]|nr:hypothetical protein [Trebonia sp.]